MLPEIEYHAEEVTVTRSSYKYHGDQGCEHEWVLICTLAFEWSGGARSFNLILDDRAGSQFVRDLCEVFGVKSLFGEEQAALNSLHGRGVRALWYRRNGAVEGIEVDGRRFLFWEWRRRMYPSLRVLDPRAEQIANLRREIDSRERCLCKFRAELTSAVVAAYDWPAIAAAANALRAAGTAWRDSAEFDSSGSSGIEVWANTIYAHDAVGSHDPQAIAACVRRILRMTTVEPIRVAAERLRAELGDLG